MRILSEQPMPRTRNSHERQNNNNKDDHETSSQYKTLSMGDIGTHSNSNFSLRSSDAVSCWGDVPKRPTRLADLITEIDGESSTAQRSTSTNTGSTHRHTERYHDVQPNSSKTYSPRSKQTSSCSTESRNSNEESGSKTKSSTGNNTAGREKLLEWLRSSQAKRDENNRQVFTRWIDRIESMSNQEAVAANLSSAAAAAAAIAAAGNTVGHLDFQHNTLFAPPTLPGLLTTPAFVIGNPVSVMPNINPQGNAHFSKTNSPFQTPVNAAYLPTLLSTKASGLNGTSFVPGFNSLLTNLASPSNNLIEGLHNEANINSPTDSSSLTPDMIKPDLMSQTQNNAHICGSGLTSFCSDSSGSSMSNCESISPPQSVITPGSVNSGLVSDENEVNRQNKQSAPNMYPQQHPPLGQLDAAAMTPNQGIPGGYQPHSYYITMPYVSDPLCPQMFYYYYYQNQLSSIMSAASGTGSQAKSFGINQPFVYFVPTAPTGAQIPSTGQPFYMTENYYCMPAIHQVPEAVGFDGISRMPDSSSSGIQNSTTYSSGVPMNSIYSNEPNKTDGTTVTDVSASETNSILPGGGMTSGESIQLEHDESTRNSGNQSADPLEFDVNKWYAVLQDISSNATSDSTPGPNSGLDSNAVMHQVRSEQPLLLDGGPVNS
ncbi:unnamed protein product [Calicophoron daubneyi]|uniref:Uncharacterized protein n=1 Tax=Calicophoron daubneyi TaxID=300641 RepID=A0AAV2TS54_CALDB